MQTELNLSETQTYIYFEKTGWISASKIFIVSFSLAEKLPTKSCDRFFDFEIQLTESAKLLLTSVFSQWSCSFFLKLEAIFHISFAKLSLESFLLECQD